MGLEWLSQIIGLTVHALVLCCPIYSLHCNDSDELGFFKNKIDCALHLTATFSSMFSLFSF